MVLLGAFPLHSALGGAIAAADTSAGVIVSTALPAIGACALLRIGCSVLPEGMRWASGVVVALGAVSASYGALACFAEGDLRRMAAFATTSQAGFVLLGAGSLTAQGFAGAIVVVAMRALACGAFLMLAGAADDRARTRDTNRLAGIGAEMPGFAVVLAIAALAQAGVLGLGTAWGPLLGLFGAMPSYAPLALVAAFGLVVGSAAHLRAVGRVAFGVLDVAWKRDPILAPHGGRFMDLSSREWIGIAPLATLVVILGLWPSPIIGVTSGTVRDLTYAVSPPGPDRIADR
jgi:NADH-quinone oxidoreductase subunit M